MVQGQGELDVYVLGAGASHEDGAPLTDKIIPHALGLTNGGPADKLGVVRQFLSEVFHFDADREGASENYPRLVDVLSVVDVALDRKESLAHGYGQQRLRKVRKALEYAIFRALQDSLSDEGARPGATRDLVRCLTPECCVIISLNYDLIVDIALSNRFSTGSMFDAADSGSRQGQEQAAIDYGVTFANEPRPQDPGSQFKLLKLHGSYNWLWSPTDGNLYYGGLTKMIAAVFEEEPRDLRQLLGAQAPDDLQPILITPTHLKDLRNVHLAVLWQKAEHALRRARKVTFIGYSLPPDDLHVKYLLKRALETRELAAPQIVVVDKAQPSETQVQANYERFFGGSVDYHRKGFEQYVREEMPDAPR